MKFDSSNTFCISLEGHPRWDRMKKRFDIFSMEVTRWKASTPETLTDHFDTRLSNGQRACAQSHKNLWRHIVDSNLPYALILEDDAMFRKDWIQILSTLNMSDGWDAVFLNASEPDSVHERWISARDQFLTAGYILSNQGAMKLLSRWSGMLCSSDWMTSRLQLDGRCYTYFPWLIIQEGCESTIGGGVTEDHAKVLRCLDEADYALSNYV